MRSWRPASPPSRASRACSKAVIAAGAGRLGARPSRLRSQLPCPTGLQEPAMVGCRKNSRVWQNRANMHSTQPVSRPVELGLPQKMPDGEFRAGRPWVHMGSKLPIRLRIRARATPLGSTAEAVSVSARRRACQTFPRGWDAPGRRGRGGAARRPIPRTALPRAPAVRGRRCSQGSATRREGGARGARPRARRLETHARWILFGLGRALR